MGKRRFKTIKLFLKLMLLFQIYSHHAFPAEATPNSIPKSCDKCEVGGEREMKKDDSVLDRPKKPARLLPLRMILGNEKNKTEMENKRFYGPATSCEELLKIGYTRNGFYLIKGNATSNNNHVEIVDCLFKRPNGIKEVGQKRLGPIPLKIENTIPITTQNNRTYYHSKLQDQNKNNTIPKTTKNNRSSIPPKKKNKIPPKINNSEVHQGKSVVIFGDYIIDLSELERWKRPIRLLPPHLFFGKEKNDAEDENVAKSFYGPPSNCIELAKLGYTLNGYYLANGSKSSNSIEIILCRFQLPSGVNETPLEERLGFINLDQLQSSSREIKAALERKIRPVRLLPPRRRIDKGENKTEEKQNVQRLISNPASCNDIGILGHTLNGYYLVNSSESAGQFGVVFCQFKMPPGAIRSMNEDKFGLINLKERINKNIEKTKKPNQQAGNKVKSGSRNKKTPNPNFKRIGNGKWIKVTKKSNIVKTP